jgi:hypothetical protein
LTGPVLPEIKSEDTHSLIRERNKKVDKYRRIETYAKLLLGKNSKIQLPKNISNTHTWKEDEIELFNECQQCRPDIRFNSRVDRRVPKTNLIKKVLLFNLIEVHSAMGKC